MEHVDQTYGGCRHNLDISKESIGGRSSANVVFPILNILNLALNYMYIHISDMIAYKVGNNRRSLGVFVDDFAREELLHEGMVTLIPQYQL